MGIGLDGFGSALAVAADTLGLLGGSGGAAIPGSSFSIQEIGGRSIVLRDRAMPFQGVEFPVEMRTKRTIYPGNPVASLQVLGLDNLPTELEGEWNYRFLAKSAVVDGDQDAIKTPAQLCDVFDTIVRSGRTVRVQWLNFVRTGVLKKFTPKWPRANDCQWSMSFEWLSADDFAPTRPKVPKKGFGISDFMKALNFAEDCLVLGPALARSLSASLVSNIKAIREKISTVIQAFGAIEALVNLPAAVLGAIDAAISSICDECREMIRRLSGPRMSARPATTAAVAAAAISSDPTQPGGAVQSSSSQQSQFEAWARTTARAVSDLRNQAIVAGIELHNAIRPEASKVVTVRSGETLLSIAAREYGSADYANYLAQQNGLQGVMPPAGIALVVPARPFGAAPDVEPTATEVITLTNPAQCQV
jgi:hypothetical protein